MLLRSSRQRVMRPSLLPLTSCVLLMVWLVPSMALLPAIPAHAAALKSATIFTLVPPDLTAVEVNFQGSCGLTLHSTIIEPAHAQAGRPGVVLVAGAGPGLRTELLPEATAFARQGLSILIYDKRSVGYSLFQRSYSQLADDALAAVRTLRAHRGVDPAKVGIWGFSEGGWVAPLAASRSADIAFVIVVGGNAMEPLRQETWTVANALHRGGVSGSLLDRTEPALFRLLVSSGTFAEAYYDAQTVLRHVRQPLLGVWGSDDLITPPGENPPLFAQALSQGGNAHYLFRFFKGADHAAHQSPDGGVTRLPALAPGYAELVGTFVHEVTSGRLPQADVPVAPHQDWQSRPVPLSPWWESAWVQLVAFALLITAFAEYPLIALVRCLRGSSPRASIGAPARLLAGAGAGAVLGLCVYLLSLLVSGERGIAPSLVLAGRPLPWLLLQALALVTVGAEVWAAVAWRRAESSVSRGERQRLGLLLAGGALFVPWALSWGLLLP